MRNILAQTIFYLQMQAEKFNAFRENRNVKIGIPLT